MEVDKKTLKDNPTKKFILILVIMLGMVLVVSGILFRFSLKGNIVLYQLIFFVSILLLMVIGVSLLLTIFAITMLWYNKNIPFIIKKIMEKFMNISQPLVIELGRLLRYNKNTISRAYTNLNNQLVLNEKYKFRGEEILVLTPHCIQKSFCPHKITNDIYNCKRCGRCDVDNLIALKEKYGFHFRLVTGGTLARKVIVELRPKAIIAIACERDLLSGLMDVKKIPILAIVNYRPEGPCINTQVDIIEVEKAVLHFIKE